MKKKIIAMCATVALATVAVTGTLAYFTADDSATNTFTVGNVAIDLIEPGWEASGSEDAPEVYPGEALAKDPQVTNEGANPCFVRIKVTGLDSLKNAGAGEIALRYNYAPGYNTTNWTLHTDGYYYYNGVLAAEATTEALFTQIVMPTDLENGDGKTTYDVKVFAEAVQAQGAKASWAAVQGMTVEEIAAWFGTCGL